MITAQKRVQLKIATLLSLVSRSLHAGCICTPVHPHFHFQLIIFYMCINNMPGIVDEQISIFLGRRPVSVRIMPTMNILVAPHSKEQKLPESPAPAYRLNTCNSQEKI